jgi:hypothetical protein
MDLKLLVDALQIFLAPALPYLLTAADKATGEVGKQVGGAALEKAKTVWGKLRPAVEARPAALEAAQDAAKAAPDADEQAAWRIQLRKILENDPELAQELQNLVKPQQHYQAQVQGGGAIAQGTGAVAAGAGGIAMGGSVQGSVIQGGREDKES